MNAYLYRYKSSALCTLGLLYIQGQTFAVLEPPWKQNRTNISCIPSARYNSVYLPRSASGKYTKVYHVKAVPNRLGILIHAGNLAKHTLGCLLIGKKHGKLLGQDAVLNSKTALREFVELTDKQDINLYIFGTQRIGDSHD